MTDTNDAVALRIKSIRELHGLTQIEFAKRLDVALPIIEAFEANRMVIDDRIINRICDEFDVIKKWLEFG